MGAIFNIVFSVLVMCIYTYIGLVAISVNEPVTEWYSVLSIVSEWRGDK